MRVEPPVRDINYLLGRVDRLVHLLEVALAVDKELAVGVLSDRREGGVSVEPGVGPVDLRKC